MTVISECKLEIQHTFPSVWTTLPSAPVVPPNVWPTIRPALLSVYFAKRETFWKVSQYFNSFCNYYFRAPDLYRINQCFRLVLFEYFYEYFMKLGTTQIGWEAPTHFESVETFRNFHRFHWIEIERYDRRQFSYPLLHSLLQRNRCSLESSPDFSHKLHGISDGVNGHEWFESQHDFSVQTKPFVRECGLEYWISTEKLP